VLTDIHNIRAAAADLLNRNCPISSRELEKAADNYSALQSRITELEAENGRLKLALTDAHDCTAEAKAELAKVRVEVLTKAADYIDRCIKPDPTELEFVLNPFDSAEARGISTGMRSVSEWLRKGGVENDAAAPTEGQGGQDEV
jgi:hypothetical protein